MIDALPNMLLRERPDDAAPTAAQAAPSETGDTSSVFIRRLIKSIVALVLVVVVGWRPVMALLDASSVEAFVNARVITLRAPIDGQIAALGADVAVGVALPVGAELIRIEEPRFDRAREFDIKRALDASQAAQVIATKRIATLEKLRSDLAGQMNAFREGRVRQLRERVAEIDEKIASAKAVHADAQLELSRNRNLAPGGSVPKSALDRSIRDEAVAAQFVKQLHHQRAALIVEQEAAEQNRFIGDSFNDRPRSAQRIDEIEQSMSETTAVLEGHASETARLRRALDEERARIALLSLAEIRVPQPSSVWEVLTAPGEEVNRGQELARLLDCSGAVVSAAVDESVYNTLKVGDEAVFRMRGETTGRPGKIIRLSGLASAPANLAISPSTLLKAPYRATIQVPSLTQAGNCDVGRTGKVSFRPAGKQTGTDKTDVRVP